MYLQNDDTWHVNMIDDFKINTANPDCRSRAKIFSWQKVFSLYVFSLSPSIEKKTYVLYDSWSKIGGEKASKRARAPTEKDK